MTKQLTTITLVGTYGLLLMGGLVHGTGSGLACPDWPTCHGSLFPRMQGGVAIEHSHRLVAALVGLLTIALAVVLGRSGRWKVGILAVVMVVVQGVLGGLTVLYGLPDLVSTAHLALSMAFFSLLCYVRWTSQVDAKVFAVSPSSKRVVMLTVLAVYLQIVLGALVRHTESGLACSGWVLCHGSLWPISAHPSARLHMAHRLGGLLVLALVLASARVAWQMRPTLARTLSGLVLGQVLLGLFSVRTGLSLLAVQAHLAVATALLGTMLWLWLSLRADVPCTHSLVEVRA